MMRFYIFALSFFMAGLVSAEPSFFGTVDGGGGKGVVCKGADGNIQSVHMLDLFEATALYGLSIVNDDAPYHQQVQQVQKKLALLMHQSNVHFDPLVVRVQSILRFTAPGVSLKPIDDALEVITPKNCTVEQVANYVDDSLLIVNGDFWNKMNEQNKAALIIHEAMYRHQRSEGAVDSRRTRKIVAHLFADFQFINPLENLPPQKLYCEAKSLGSASLRYAFYLYAKPGFKSQIQFTFFKGFTVLSKKTSILPLSFPWFPSAVSENGFGATVNSNFEGNDFFQIASETIDGNIEFVIRDAQEKNIIKCHGAEDPLSFNIEDVFDVIPAPYQYPDGQIELNFLRILKFNYVSNLRSEFTLSRVRLEVGTLWMSEFYQQDRSCDEKIIPHSAGQGVRFGPPLIFSGFKPKVSGVIQGSLVFEGTTKDGIFLAVRTPFKLRVTED